MIGAHSRVSIQLRQRSVLSKRHLVRTFYHLISVRGLLIRAELQGQNSSAVVGEMRDALIDNWA